MLTAVCNSAIINVTGAYDVGVPAKSGVGGCVFFVIPNVAGVAIWSPRLDAYGNSVRGVAVAKELVKHFAFHNFEVFSGMARTKMDPQKRRGADARKVVGEVLFAASQGDTDALAAHLAAGVDLYEGDYDDRTALHLASSEGHVDTVDFLVENAASVAEIDQKDRWGATALDNAEENGWSDVDSILRDAGLAPSEYQRRYTRASDSTHGRVHSGVEEDVHGNLVDKTPPTRAKDGDAADGNDDAGGNVEHPFISDSAVVTIYAAATGDLDHLIALSAAGVDLGTADYDRRTALHLAASNGHVEVARYLLAQAANPHTVTRSLVGWLAATDRFGNTAAQDAARGRHAEVLKLLDGAAQKV